MLALTASAGADVRSTVSPTANGRFDQPMRLGVTDAAPRRGELARQQTPQNNCRKWRRIAERLGETFAGIRLRQSVVDRACLFAATELASITGGIGGAETSFDHLWSWPWADGAIDPALPPRLHATHGDWSIRCGQAGRRERCALILETVAHRADAATGRASFGAEANAPAAVSQAANVVTHFVIDTIGGYSHVVWRVFVERGDASWFARTVDPADAASADLSRNDLVRFSSGSITGAKRFDGCSSAGCLMEADMTTSSRLATQLWEGNSGEISIAPAVGIAMTAKISAYGLRTGLAELARLKRSEDKILARN
jgi:invasion protein IalB